MRKEKPRSVQQGIRKSTNEKNPDPYNNETLIRTSEKPRSVQQGNDPSDEKNEGTVVERGEQPVHAAENSAALPADASGSGSRPLMPFSDNPYHAVKPGETRHRLSAAQQDVYYATSPKPEANLDSGSSLAFQILSEFGCKLLAGYGLGEIPWAEVRSDLQRCANRLGVGSPENRGSSRYTELLERVEGSLRAQHAHFLTSGQATPAPPSEKTAVRPAGEVEL